MLGKKMSPSTGVHNWRELYHAALFETDPQKRSYRIAEAERALTLRARELFNVLGSNEETRALDKGRYGLRALRTCLKLNASQTDAA